MILANINLGTGPGTGDGDPLRSAFNTINENFSAIESNVNSLSNSVTSVAGRTGNIVLTTQDIVGIGAYANTAYMTTLVTDQVNALSFASNSSVDNKIAANISAVIGTAPTALNTLGKIAAALGNDSAYSSNVTVSINSLIANAGAQSTAITEIENDVALLTAGAAFQSTRTGDLIANAGIQAGQISNVAANLSLLQSTLTANAATQAEQISNITSVIIPQVDANVSNLQSNLTVLTSEVGTLSGDISYLIDTTNGLTANVNILTANAGAQANAISSLQSEIDAINSQDSNLANLIIAAEGNIVIANTAMKGYVDSQVSTLINGAPGTLDTLNEIAAALGNDANLSVTLTNLISNVQSNVVTVQNNVNGVQANVTAANAAIVEANTLMKGYVDNQVSTLTANAATQAEQIANLVSNLSTVESTLTANAAVQAVQISNLAANLSTVDSNLTANAAIITILQGNIGTLIANAGAQSVAIESLVSNAGVQHNSIEALIGNVSIAQANIVTINSNIANLEANAAAQQTLIDGLGSVDLVAFSANITELQSAVGVHTGQIFDLQGNAATQAGQIAVLTANAATQAGQIAALGNTAAIQSNISTLQSTVASQGNSITAISANVSILQANVTALALGNVQMKAYVDSKITANISALIGGAPSTLDTLNELATALGNDANLSVTITNTIANVNANISTLFANAGIQAGNISVLQSAVGSLTGNAVTQQGNIALLEDNYTNLENTVSSQQLEIINITTGNKQFANLIPSANVTYSLGSPTAQWKELWVSGDTIYIGGVPLSIDEGNLQINNVPLSQTIVYSEIQNAPVDISDFADSGNLLVTPTENVFGVSALSRQIADITWSDGLYAVNLGGNSGDPSDPLDKITIRINTQSGSYVIVNTTQSLETYTDYAVGNYTILGTDLGGVSPANDLIINIPALSGTDVLAQSNETPILGPTPTKASFRFIPTSIDIQFEMVDGGLGWPETTIEGFSVSFNPQDFTGDFVIEVTSTGINGEILTFDVVTNTLSYTGSYSPTELVVVSGTPNTNNFFNNVFAQGDTVNLNYSPKQDSVLEVIYSWAVLNPATFNPNIFTQSETLELTSDNWELSGNVLIVPFDPVLQEQGNASFGSIVITERNNNGLNLNADIGPFTAGYTITDGGSSLSGFNGIAPVYNLLLNLSNNATELQIVSKGEQWMPGSSITITNVGSGEVIGDLDGLEDITLVITPIADTVGVRPVVAAVEGGNVAFNDVIIGGNLTVANDIDFIMANYQHWTSNVSTISAALNQLAERIWNIENP